MDAYIYQAARYCEDCIIPIKVDLEWEQEDKPELRYDSSEYPKGPFADGGGEADSPAHCGCCHVHLENPLTGDGEMYVRFEADIADGQGDVLDDWRYYYSYLWE